MSWAECKPFDTGYAARRNAIAELELLSRRTLQEARFVHAEELRETFSA